jgi:hypothetical protein
MAEAMHLRQPGRVGEILRGKAWPADPAQAEALLTALGAVGREVERGMLLYKAARAERDSVPRPDAGWWRRSAYIEQVRDIAPLDLLDRQSEFGELTAWCQTGEEAYVWWQAGAWAGKSALMSWMVLHPPPDVWVVSFFVTARYAGQADSAAFTDGLIDQLAAITGDQVQPAASAAERDRLRRRLLSEAVGVAAKVGRRLVLLVDGLDEDCGAGPGSGMPSIAASLPKRPAEGLRVIVAGRPDPPIPADVDPDHPLRSCRVRVLQRSPHAERVTGLAQRELDDVLATDPRRHDGLGFQVLGLVTACGGGLSLRDLGQLTGKPVFEIDHLLRGVFGRTIAGRADRVLLFTHETLRVQAVERLGPETLARFAERIHIWADGYRRRGWAQGTPAYLLRGYARALSVPAELPRLVALVTDPARHDRMLAVLGGDAAALTDITTAFTLLTAQPEPDLAAALRLAWQRDRLADRNRFMPVALPSLWLRLGQPVRAEALARSISEDGQRQDSLLGLIDTLNATGDHDGAEALARSFAGWGPESRGVLRVAVSIAEGGDFDRAEQVAQSLPQSDGYVYEHRSGIAFSRSRTSLELHVLTEFIEIAARSRARDRVTALIGKLALAEPSAEDLLWHEDALADAVVAVASAGYHDEARRIGRLLRLSATDGHRVLTEWAAATAAAGDQQTAGKLIERAGELAELITDDDWHVRQRVRAAIDAGEFDEAERLARAEAEERDQAELLTGVVRAIARAGDYAKAELLARSIPDHEPQAKALAEVSSAMLSAGEFDRAEALALSHPPRTALAGLVAALLDVGETDRAEAITASVVDPETSVMMMIALAGSADRGPVIEILDRAEALTRSVDSASGRAELLTKLGVIAIDRGERDRAARLAEAAEKAAHFGFSEFHRGQAVTGLAFALAQIGDFDRAEAVTLSHDSPALRWLPLTALMSVAARSGDYARAERIAHSIDDPDPRADALIELAGHMTDRKQAAALLDEAEALIQAIERPRDQFHVLIKLAEAATDAGDHDRAMAFSERAREVAYARCEEFYQSWSEISAARAVAGAGDIDRAEGIACALKPDFIAAQALREVVEIVARSGEYDRAVTIARSISDRDWQLRVFAERTAALVDVGEHDRATALVAEAESIMSNGASEAGRTSLVDAFIAIGDHDRAQSVARSFSEIRERLRVMTRLAAQVRAAHDDRLADILVADVEAEIPGIYHQPRDRAQALIALSEVVEEPQARVLVTQALAVGPWTDALGAVARVDPEAVRSFVGEYGL